MSFAVPCTHFVPAQLPHLLDFPKIILDIERVELEIACGLQDRVVQTYGGLVHMDFTGTENLYTDQDTALLPPMYLAYNSKVGKIMSI